MNVITSQLQYIGTWNLGTFFDIPHTVLPSQSHNFWPILELQ